MEIISVGLYIYFAQYVIVCFVLRFCIVIGAYLELLRGFWYMDAFSVTVNHEELIVTLKASGKLPGTVTSQPELSLLLKENNVFKGIDKAEINRAFTELAELKEQKEYIIARGKAPKNGTDGRLEFHVNVSGKAEYTGGGSENNSVQLDYKNAVSVESVVEGDRLVTVIHPTLGEDGYNLSGKALAAKNGKEVAIVLSEGVEFDAAGTEVIATSHGRPVFSHGILAVRSIYDVPGDVCYETGNIKFNGHVHIAGNVQDEFSVDAYSVEILGVVGSAVIKSKGDLIIRGGVNGRGKASVVCGGNAEIKYVNAATLEVKGDLVVQKEIVNAEVRCNGKINSKKIIGGEVGGLKGIEAVQIGSEVGTPTLILPGNNYEVERIENAMSVLSVQIGEALKPIKNNLGDREFFKKLDADKRNSVIQIYTYFKRLKSAYLRLIRGKELIQNSDKFTPLKEVIVRNRLYQDVCIRTSYCSKTYMVEVGGPVKIVEDINNASMKNILCQESDGSEE